MEITSDNLDVIVRKLPLEELSERDAEFVESLRTRVKQGRPLMRSHSNMAKVKLKKYRHLIEQLDEEESDTERKACLNKKTINAFIQHDDIMAKRIVEALPGASWRKKKGCWSFPLRLNIVEKLEQAGFELGPKLEEWKDNQTQVITNDVTGVDYIDENLRSYQRLGVNFIHSRSGRALLADEMGLGKTIQALGYLILDDVNALPATVICPASVKRKWAREIEKWTDFEVEVLDGYWTPDKEESDADIIVANYTILYTTEKLKDVKQLCDKKTYKEKKKQEDLKGEIIHPRPDLGDFTTLIIDEAHTIKNNKTKQSIAVKKIGRQCDRVIGLTGTPVEKKPYDIWNILQLVNKYAIPDFWEYVMRYCEAEHDGYGWNFDGASNIGELHEMLTKTIMLRRRKTDVLKELPAKQYSIIPLEWDNKTYNKMREEIREWLNSNPDADTALVKIEALKHSAVKAKLNDMVKWIEEFLEEEQKLVVFTRRVDTMDWLLAKLKKYNPTKVDGRTTKRDEAIEKFQHDESCRLFFGQMKAAGTGIDLTAASSVAFAEFDWTPATHDQCADRVHRIGQEENVTIYYLVAENTIEDKIVKMLDERGNTVSQIMDGEEQDEQKMVSELIEEYKK